METTFDMLELSSLLTNPAIVMIILGGILFILGFCGCLGALLEIFFLLVIVIINIITEDKKIDIISFPFSIL